MSRTLFLLLSVALPAFAEPVRDHDITVDDYATIATITELAVSPDGKHVAYCEARWDAADDSRKTDLWVVATDGKGKPTRLTGERANDRHPKWSHDGKAIYVLGNRKHTGETKPPYDGKSQVWRVPLDGGEPRAVTRVEGGIVEYDYAPQADAVFYAVDASATDHDPFTHLREKYKVEYGHGQRKVSEVYRLDLQSWRSEKAIADNRYVREFAVTRDGKRVGMIAAPDDTVVQSEGNSRVDVWDADTKKVTVTDESWRKTAASPWPWLESLAWSPDGKRLAFCSIFDAFPAELIIDTLKEGKWAGERMRRKRGAQVQGYGSPLHWPDPDRLGFLAEEEGRISLLHYMPSVGQTDGPMAPGQILVVGDDAMDVYVALRGTPDSFPCLETWNGIDFTLNADPNRHSQSWKFPSIQHITWKAPDGTEVGGILELPFGYKKGDKLPLVVGIHGGPTTSNKAELTYDPLNGRLYFAAHGYAALYPNYRGSTGYGDKFVTDLIGHENDIEVKDILAGIQHLIKEGIADPDRVGVMGWSNGGYLTNCLITLKDSPVKFKAASSGAGIVDTVAEWGFNDEPAFPRVFKKGLPWETPDIYRKTSATFGLGNVTTPTLIHVGGADERCPPGHSRMLYRALKEYVKVPTELVVYPGEPHGLTKLSNRKAKMEWDLAWFDRYLKGAK
jgi:dipeptidyl aminopeptidase/acylaminoacyl peptidase